MNHYICPLKESLSSILLSVFELIVGVLLLISPGWIIATFPLLEML